MSKSVGWTANKKKLFGEFIRLNKNYLNEFFNEKLRNPRINQPIKSGFFNEMADYIDYNKHCCRSYFKRNLGAIFGKILHRSPRECAIFLSFLEKNKKTIKKKRPSNLTKHEKKIRRRFNRLLRAKPLSARKVTAGATNSETDQLLINESMQAPGEAGNRNIADRDSDVGFPIRTPVLEIEPRVGRNPERTAQQIFVEQSSKTDSFGESALAKSLRSNFAFLPQRGDLEETCMDDFAVRRLCPQQSKLESFSSNGENPLNLISAQWDSTSRAAPFIPGASSGFSIESPPNRAARLKSFVALESEPCSLARDSTQNKRGSGFKIKLQKVPAAQADPQLSADICFCENCTSREAYLIREMRFKSHSSRVKVTPAIFKEIRKVRFCLDCFQPVLKGVDKAQFIVPQQAPSARASILVSEAPFETSVFADGPNEEQIFLSEDSERIVSNSSSKDFLNLKNTGTAEKTVPKVKSGLETEIFGTIKTKKRKETGAAKRRNLLRIPISSEGGFDRRPQFESFDAIEERKNHLGTVKRSPRHFPRELSGASEETLVQEMRIEGSSNQIEQIKGDLEQFRSFGEFGQVSSNWVVDLSAKQLETTSLAGDTLLFNQEPAALKGELADNSLKGIIRKIRKDTLGRYLEGKIDRIKAPDNKCFAL